MSSRSRAFRAAGAAKSANIIRMTTNYDGFLKLGHVHGGNFILRSANKNQFKLAYAHKYDQLIGRAPAAPYTGAADGSEYWSCPRIWCCEHVLLGHVPPHASPRETSFTACEPFGSPREPSPLCICSHQWRWNSGERHHSGRWSCSRICCEHVLLSHVSPHASPQCVCWPPPQHPQHPPSHPGIRTRT